MSVHSITVTVNGIQITRDVPAHRTLLEFLRDTLNLTGAKEGCGAGECGACTVLMDGVPLRSCLILAAEADGHTITTIEGLAQPSGLHPVQQAFLDAGAIQCGYCTPGFVLAAHALLQRNPNPSDDEILAAFGGHLCRCTGYQVLLQAVRLAAQRTQEKRTE